MPEIMTKMEMLGLLETWLKTYEGLNKVMDPLMDLTGGEMDDPLPTGVYRCFDHYTDMLARVMGADDWLDWYLYENDCGRKGYKAKTGSMKAYKRIRNLRDLVILLVYNREDKQ